MATVKQIRRRIRSVQSTQQITKAMQMVAAAKLRKAQSRAEAARPYAAAMERALAKLSGAARSLSHPLFEEREVKCVLLAVV
ncbi:MAG: F0F1 ATP synthase subunit gamma, partial [Candidatus Eisenbacteria sp.]|nr:F0F1 ATP synthase subunit gamma [Candidatus Eisenbacteria bacterium]